MKNTLIFIVGLVILVLAFILDLIGIPNTKEGFGLVQIIGAVVGGVLLVYGLVKMGKKK